MDLQTAEQERTIRFYRWALDEFMREHQQDYPLLRSMRDSAASGLIAYISTLSPQEAIILIAALVKRFHPTATALLGEALSSDENARLAEWNRCSMSFISAQNQPILRRLESEKLTANTKRLKAFIVKGIKDILPDSSITEKQPFNFINSWGDWRVETDIDIHRRGGCVLTYRHLIYRLDFSTTPIEGFGNHMPYTRVTSHGWTDILSWMGLGHSRWEVNFADEEEDIARTALQICKYFLDHLPDFLHGLNIDD